MQTVFVFINRIRLYLSSNFNLVSLKVVMQVDSKKERKSLKKPCCKLKGNEKFMLHR